MGNDESHTQAILPKKLIVCGRYRNLDIMQDRKAMGSHDQPFVALVDLHELERGRHNLAAQDLTMIKCFQSSSPA